MCPGYHDYYGLPLSDVIDGRTAEDFLATNESGPGHQVDWATQYQLAVLYEAQNATAYEQWTAISYPENRDEDYYCYCTAKLCNLAYAENVGNNGGRCQWGIWPELTNLRLGRPLDSGPGAKKLGSVFYRQYAKGLVFVIPGTSQVQVQLPRQLRFARLDVYSGIEVPASETTLALPPRSGRVFISH
jgi:hypothetical protein